MPLTDTHRRILHLIVENSDLDMNEDNRLDILASDLSLSVEITRSGLVRLEKVGFIVRSGGSAKFYVPTGTGTTMIRQEG